MTRLNIPLPQTRALAETSRQDRWWIQPLLVFLGLSAFVVYSTWAGIQGKNYWVPNTHYLSPMYSPVIFDAPGQNSGHAILGPWPESLAWLPWFMTTPAILILWIPAGFRFTCYYYRGAYYKAFWADPLSCSVGEPKFRGKKYRGEQKLPLIIQNAHRYFFYLAAAFIFFLSYDAVMSYFFKDPATGKTGFGIGIGTLILTINPILLGGYTFGCHVFRHLIGGKKDHLSKLGPRKPMYECVSCLNRRHMLWAWMSLIWVGFTDFYVRMVASGAWHDFRIL